MFPGYDNFVSQYISKSTERLYLQMKWHNFGFSDLISTIELQIIFKLGCDTDCIHIGAVTWAMKSPAPDRFTVSLYSYLALREDI